MRMSCVILQRRLPLRSGAVACLMDASTVGFLVISLCIGSFCDAMSEADLPDESLSIQEEVYFAGDTKTYSENVPVKR